jgi:glycerol-3-phosphate dehydrogenase
MFSFQTREESLRRFQHEEFDLLIIGGGITGAATARDASMRGLKVALVERADFAHGTSSRSSKLIHGGLRYLENMEFGLVFEALAERALLLKTTPHLVNPLEFYMPVYKGDTNGRTLLSLGLWLYDLLALFRTPGRHKRLSASALLKKIPSLRSEGLKGGFRYYDASMWDDVLAVQLLRSATEHGAAVANYVEAGEPIWNATRISGFMVKNKEKGQDAPSIALRAKQVIVCAGPYTDEIGIKLSSDWKPWLNPSKGVHLIFDLKRLPIPGAVVMAHPHDGRISFVIPRTDYGAGVVIVGTTDGATPADPDKATIDPSDVAYLMTLLTRYFPNLKLTTRDILSAYVGVRPLMAAPAAGEPSASLQKVSREHYIGTGPGATVLVAGGKYTTHRRMAGEIVDETLKHWRAAAARGQAPSIPRPLKTPHTEEPANPQLLPAAIVEATNEAQAKGVTIPPSLLFRYGKDALRMLTMENSKQTDSSGGGSIAAPAGFPCLEAQLRHTMQNEMVLHLEDFYLRRIPLFATRSDSGLPWAEQLARVWADERGVGEDEMQTELNRLRDELARRSMWKERVES